MDGTAVVVTDGHLADIYGKTAHGLIRGSKRYKIVAVIDAQHAGRDAGEVLDGQHRGIPVFVSLKAMQAAVNSQPDYCIIGCATHGGVMSSTLRPILEEALGAGISIVNGLHEFLSDDPTWQALAKQAGASILDVRKPQSRFHFWTGEILTVQTPRIAILGTDCAVGKRTTARLLLKACSRHRIRADMIYTGQTGWMQGFRYGSMLDAVPNDFVSGELEHAILSADSEHPDVIFLEGQSALRNPSGPCGSEFILSGGARGVILQHAPGRRYFSGLAELGCEIPDISGDIELIRLLGACVLGLALNGEGLTPEQLGAERDRLCRAFDLPVALPLEEGVEPLIPAIKGYLEKAS